MKQPQNDQATFLDNVSQIGYLSSDLSGTILEWNKSCETLFGYTKEEAIGHTIQELILPAYLKESFLNDFKERCGLYGTEQEYLTKEGQSLILSTNAMFLGDRYYALLVDPKAFRVTNQLESAIHLSHDRLTNSVEMMMISLDRNGYINDFNHFAEELTGYRKDEVLGRNFVELFLPQTHKEKTLEQIQKSFAAKKIYMPSDFPLICRNGEKIIVHWERSLIASQDDKKGSLLLLGEHKSTDGNIQDRLEYLANYDALTDLPNRNLLYDRLRNAINKAARTGQNMITIFINLDNFKAINHTLGYALGDKLLKEVASRLQSDLRDHDTVARFSGDEFVILFENVNDELAAGTLAQRISDLFNTPFQIGDNEIAVHANMGISFFPSDGNDPKTLIKNANMAMLRAKEDKQNNYHFFKAQIHEEITRRIQLESNMRKAIKNREFFVEYQPLVDAKTEKVIGAEALVRWNHPDLQIIPPLDFIPVAEDTGMILEIGEMVLESAITQMQEWHKKGYDHLKISVNISGIQLLQSNLEETIDAILEKTGFNPAFLQLELTESTLMQNIDLATKLLEHFKSKNILISIDDFGTGYSSLNYLKRLPIDSLKIDQSFIHNIETDQSDKIIVNTVIAMGHSLGLAVVAEGIEDLQQKNYLQKHGCDILQGFLFGRSLDTDTFETLLEHGFISEEYRSDTSKESYALEQKMRKYSKPLKISF